MTSLGINVIYFVLLDRLMMADVQRRSGPQNVGAFGSLQAMDDGLKLIKKELIIAAAIPWSNEILKLR